MNDSTTWSQTTRYIVAVALGMAAIGIALFAAPVLLLSIIAALIAFLVHPVIRFLQARLRLPRIVAVLSVNLVVAIVIALSPLILVPFVNDIAGSIRAVNETLSESEILDEPLVPANDDLDDLEENMLAGQAFGIILRVLPDLIGHGATIFLVYFYLISACTYFSLDGPTWRQQIPQLAPSASRPEVEVLVDRVARVWTAFMRGQLIVMTIIGLLVWIVLSVLGVPGAASLGLLAFFMELIPNLGPTLATIPAVLVAFLNDSTTLPVSNLPFAVIVLLFYVILQQLETYVVTPRIMGKAVEIYPMIITATVLLALPVAGLLGAFLAVPMLASGREIGGYLLAKVRGVPPYPEVAIPLEVPGTGNPEEV